MKLEVAEARRERGTLRLVVNVLDDTTDTLLHRDTVRPDTAADRLKFYTNLKDRLNGNTPPFEQVELRLLRLVSEIDDAGEAKPTRPAPSAISRLVADTWPLVHSPDDEGYARVAGGAAYPVRSRRFAALTRKLAYDAEGVMLLRDDLAEVVALVEAQAITTGAAATIHTRVAAIDGGVVLDLGDETGNAILVTATGWSMTTAPPVLFQRRNGILPLPEPRRGGTLTDLWRFVNVPDRADQALVLGWMVHALRGRGPYPLLALIAEQGAGKTSSGERIAMLVDPSRPPLRGPVRNEQDLMIGAKARFVVGFDNLSVIPDWLSDSLCRLATGSGFGARTLFTDTDETLFDGRRPVLLTSIEDAVRNGDLLDRSIIISLPQLADTARQTDHSLGQAYEAARPGLFGALLDRLAGALREEGNVHLDRLPRMADFAISAVAAERGAAEPPLVLHTYMGLRDELADRAVEATMLGPLLVAFVDSRDPQEWSGTMAALLADLGAHAGDVATRAKGWPRTARAMSSAVRRLAPALRRMGIAVDFERSGRKGERIVTLTRLPDGDDDHTPPDSPERDTQPSAPSAASAEGDSQYETDAENADGCPPDADANPTVSAQPSAAAADSEVKSPVSDGADAADGPMRPSGDDGGVEKGTASFDLVTSFAQAAAVVAALQTEGVIGLDIETAPVLGGTMADRTALDPRKGRLRLVQLATADRTYLFDAFHMDVLLLLRPLLEREDGPLLVGHNLAFDLGYFQAAGLALPPGRRLFDTQLAAQLLGAGLNPAPAYTLAATVERFLGAEVDKTEQVSDWSGAALTRSQLAYAARDAGVLLPLQQALTAALEEADLARVMALEMDVLPAMVAMMDTGAPFNLDRWVALSNAAVAEQLRREAELSDLAGGGSVDMLGGSSINWRSNPQVLTLLKARGHIVSNTAEATLKPLADVDPLVTALLAYRDATKRATTYGIKWAAKHVHDVTGRVHANYKQIGAVSGRMSCGKPNLQNIPHDRAYRACFAAPAGRVLIKADYSQVELRIAAHLTQDAAMLAAFRSGEDLHAKTAAAVLGKPANAITKADRQLAKALNFGLLYGMGAASLQDYARTDYGVTLTLEEATAHRAVFFRTYPGLRAWHRQTGSIAGEVETRTLLGRRRLNVIKFTERLNTPVQGIGADIIKAAVARLWADRATYPAAALVAVVHDEIVLEADADSATAVAAWLRGHMESVAAAVLPDVPVVVETTIAPTWAGEEG